MRWSDEYWPLVIEAYKKKPEGVKPQFSCTVVDVSLRLHIPPKEIVRRLQELQKMDSPSLRRLYDELKSPNKLRKTVQTLQKQEGFGTAGKFFDDVDTNESWELDFRPIETEPRLMPIHLIIILDLYFHLTPTTMTVETDEIRDLARQLRITPGLIVQVLDVYKFCDPYLNNSDIMIDPLLFPCKDVWNRFADSMGKKLSDTAAELKEYFK